MEDFLEYIAPIFNFISRFVINYFYFIVLAFIALHFYRRKSAHKKMQEIALKLGLQFEGSPHLRQIEARVTTLNQQQTTVSPKVLEYISKAIDFALPLFHHWELKGKWNDVPVRVYSEAEENKSRRTVVRAAIENPKGIGLNIAAEKFLSSLGKKDISSGNEELDKMIRIQATDPDQVKMLLMSPYLQDALIQAFKFSKYINIQDQYVTFYHAGVLQNEEKLRTALDHVSRTAIALRTAGR
jgi:hypothetical protein